MKIRQKNVNRQEKYACSRKDIKHIFDEDDSLFVSFGYIGKTFRFDSAFTHRPVIKGIVIASVSVYRRMDLTSDTEPYLCFYVIRDDRYDEKYTQIFTNTILPQIRGWLMKMQSKPDTALSGVERLLIEWTGAGFNLHQHSYH